MIKEISLKNILGVNQQTVLSHKFYKYFNCIFLLKNCPPIYALGL